MELLRQNFFVLLATALFLVVFFTWILIGRPGDMVFYVNSLFGSVLTALGIRLQRITTDAPTTIDAKTINADAINAGEIKENQK